MAEETTPDQTETQVPATTEAKTTDLPTANAPDPGVDKPDTVVDGAKDTVTSGTEAEATKPAAKRPPKAAADENGDAKPAKRSPKPEAEDVAEGAKSAAKAKKEKPPALEDKPFADFIQQDYLPALKTGLAKQDIQDAELVFEKRKVNVIGFVQEPECWQVIGRWRSGDKQTREFNLYFFNETINGQKGFSYSESGGKASTLESFRIDERKVDLGLLVFWTLQRLNAQKWLVRN